MGKYMVVQGIRVSKEFEPKTFGRLTTIGRAFRVSAGKGSGLTRVVCECSCGSVVCVLMEALRKGGTRSCGCLSREVSSATAKKTCTRHGCAAGGGVTTEYTAWKCMVARCTNPRDSAYDNYGGRGIRVCERWRVFENFLADMNHKPTAGHSLDRIDNNGNYEPGNCRWGTKEEQSENRRSNCPVTAFGRTQNVGQWEREFGFGCGVIGKRLRRGWSPERAITTPLMK